MGLGRQEFGIFGGTTLGYVAIFMSLVNNLCATILVGARAWCVRPIHLPDDISLSLQLRIHRRQLAEHLCFKNRRTVASRVLEILVESGIVYSAIWVSIQ